MDAPQTDVPLGCLAGNDGLSPPRSPAPEEEGEEESMDVESLGGIGRMFGAMISRFGHIPIPTQIGPEVLRQAKDICSSGALDGTGAADDRLCDLVWGWEFEGKVERQVACFFRVTVDERQASNGILISCRSYSKGKFKLLVFDSSGEVVHHEDSARSTAASGRSEATLYFTPFDTYRLGDPVPEALKEEDLPPVLGKLENFHSSRLSIQRGQHLICVYGDNFIGKTAFTIVAVPSLNECPDVAVMKELDERVLVKRAEMTALQDDFLEARAKYQALMRRVKEESVVVNDLIANREAAYINYLESSVRTYQPMDMDDPGAGPSDSPASPVAASRGSWMDGVSSGVSAGGGMILGGLSGIQGGLQAAPTTASSATGWIASSLTTGFDKINKMMGSSRSRSASEDPEYRDSPAPPTHAVLSDPPAPAAPSPVPVAEKQEKQVSTLVSAPDDHTEDRTQQDLTTDTLINSSEIPEGAPRATSDANNTLEALPDVLLPKTPPRKKSSTNEDDKKSAIGLPQPQKPALPGSEGTPDLSI